MSAVFAVAGCRLERIILELMKLSVCKCSAMGAVRPWINVASKLLVLIFEWRIISFASSTVWFHGPRDDGGTQPALLCLLVGDAQCGCGLLDWL